MTETQMARKVVHGHGMYGLGTAVVGLLLILIDGITVLGLNGVLAPSYGGALAVGWTEIGLSLLAFVSLAFYKRSIVAAVWAVVVLALIAYAFDGGFYYIGSTVAIIGAVLMYYKR